jgi:hypothetical protein
MTDDTTDNTAEQQDPADTLTVEFALDAVHADIADQMHDAGVDPADDIVKPRVTPAVEQALYEARQQAKHSQQ